MRIRLLMPIAGNIAPGVPAPAVGEPIDVDDAIADIWCDGARAELAPPDGDAGDEAIAQVHTDATTYHEAVVAQLHEDARSYHQAVVSELQAQIAQRDARIAELERTAAPADADGISEPEQQPKSAPAAPDVVKRPRR